MPLTFTIAGTSYPVLEGSLTLDDTIDLRSTAEFYVLDSTGVLTFTIGQKVTITDSTLGLLFSGFISDPKAQNYTPQATNWIDVICMDNTYLADRAFAKKDYVNMAAGDIAADLLTNYLAQEGVTGSYAIRTDTTAAQFNLGVLSNTVGATSLNDGDLELAPSGLDFTYSESTTAQFATGVLTNCVATNNALMPTVTPAIKMVSTLNSAQVGNTITSVKIWAGSVSIGSNTFLNYDIFIDPSSPQATASFNVFFSDGSNVAATGTEANGSTDGQGMLPQSSVDLTGLATTRWYNRGFAIEAGYTGKTAVSVSLDIAGTSPGTYAVYVRNATFSTGVLPGGTVAATIFGSTLNVNPPQQLQYYGYVNTRVSVVNSYDLYQRYSADTLDNGISNRIVGPLSVGSVKLLQNSFLSWTAVTPANTSVTVWYSLDDQNFVQCVNNAPLPNLPAGIDLTGKHLYLSYQFFYLQDANPELLPIIEDVSLTLNTSFAATKADVSYAVNTQAQWNAGTFTNLISNTDGELSLNGIIRFWDDGYWGGNDVYSSSNSISGSTYNRAFKIGNLWATSEGTNRNTWVGKWQNFILESDIQVPVSTVQAAMIYRQTNFGNGTNGMAYIISLSDTVFELGRGGNTTGSGSYTIINSHAVTSQAGSWHRVKVQANGSNHKCYLDDVKVTDTTDSTYSAAGYTGYHLFNPTANTVASMFDNFGIVASLSGTWVSPGTSLTPVGPYGTSIISWRDKSVLYNNGGNNTTTLVEASYDNGSTYTTCTNNAPLPGLVAGTSMVGKTLKIRVTLSSVTAASLAAIDYLTVRVLGKYATSGRRVAPASNFGPVGIAGNTLASWNGVQPANTTIGMEVSINNGASWVALGSGASGSVVIPGITTQPAPTDDIFAANTSGAYTAAARTGGSASTNTWDNAYKRVELVGGVNAALLYTGLTAQNIDMVVDSDRSDAGGLVWRWQDASNYYGLDLFDSASTQGTTNTLKLYKVVANTRTQLAALPLSFTRGTPYRFHVNMTGAAITLYQDSIQLLTTSDSAITASGQAGFSNVGGSSQFYRLRIQTLGQLTTGILALTRATLTTSDASVSPQISNITLSCRSPNIQNGALIPSTQYNVLAGSKNTLAQDFDDLCKQSGNFICYIDDDFNFYFQQRAARLAPWVLTGNDMVIVGTTGSPTLETIADLYRNDQFVTNCVDIIAIYGKTFISDGTVQTWTLDYSVDTMISITVNGIIAPLIGIQGVDTGKQFYYTPGSPIINLDTGGVALGTIVFNYNARRPVCIEMRDDPSIALRSSYDRTDGIVQAMLDGAGSSKIAGIQTASGLLVQYTVVGRTIVFDTIRGGLKSGQILSVFLPALGLWNDQFLIVDVNNIPFTSMAGGVETTLPFATVTATEGPVVGDWVRFLGDLWKH